MFNSFRMKSRQVKPHRECMERVLRGEYTICDACSDTLESLRQEDVQGRYERADMFFRAYATIWSALNPVRDVWSGSAPSLVAVLETPSVRVDGDYRVATVTTAQAQQLVDDMRQIESAVGRESTASVLTTLLGVNVPVNRRPDFVLDSGQIGIFLDMNHRVHEDATLSVDDIENIGYRLRVVVRTF